MDLQDMPVLKELSRRGYKIVLASQLSSEESAYHDTELPKPADLAKSTDLPEQVDGSAYIKKELPYRIRNMYRDLTNRQLHDYFAWREQERNGVHQPISSRAAYLYIYELLNNVGVSSPEDCIEKLLEFENGFLKAGLLGSGLEAEAMERKLRRWMLEYAVVHDLPQKIAEKAADPEMLARDAAVAILDDPDNHTDKEVFSALRRFDNGKIEKSPVITRDQERGGHLFSEVWRASRNCSFQGRSLFTLCFSRRRVRLWYPLFGVVSDDQDCRQQKDRTFELNGSRKYYCKNNKWYVESYEQLYFDRGMVRAFLHETDARLRRYLKTGHYLKEKLADEWLAPCIDSVIEADKAALLEASRPHITIDLSGLDHIREDADVTRDRLLTEEELCGAEYGAAVQAEMPAGQKPETLPEEQRLGPLPAEQNTEPASADEPEALLDDDGMQIMTILLAGDDPSEVVKARHLMPSVEADRISEILFDEIGDNVVICEDGKLSLVEDYVEDVQRLFGGTING